MFKSLYSAVSGMSANMTELDVIGNNIANSNTIGFKTGRVTFNEMLTQTIRSASRPMSGGLGGTNPQQIGLGARVGSIDSNFSQGNFQTTGIKTDLSIQGAGFFILSNGQSNSYTRAGVFGLDSDNYFVNPSTGMRVQGVMANADGVVGTGPISDIFIDPGTVVPAAASSEVQLIGNLDSNSDATGTVMESPSFYAPAAGTDLLTAMSAQSTSSLGLVPGNSITLSGQIGGVSISPPVTFTVTSGSTYQDMVDALNGGVPNLTFAIGANGELNVNNGTGLDVTNLHLSSQNKPNFNANFVFDSTITAGTTGTTANGDSGELRAYADGTDTLGTLYTSGGNELGIDFSSGSAVLVISGSTGGTSVPNNNLSVTSGTTLDTLMTEIGQTLGLSSNPVEISDTGTVILRGEVGLASALSGVQIMEDGADNTTVRTAFGFSPTQQARDQTDFTLSTTAYDSLGGQHTVTFTFEKVPDRNEWVWQAETEGDEVMLEGNSGRVSFDENGALSSFTYDGGASALTFQPQPNGSEGADIVTLALDLGDVGGLNGLTQFEGTGHLQSIADGYTAGQLVDFEIDQTGTIVGRFSNDTMRDLARVAVAQFANDGGLLREANNTYSTSGNSGEPNLVFAGDGNGVTLTPGALETSNVDLAKEFTRLVIAQRAFQANSRVVTSADTLMQELVNLVR